MQALALSLWIGASPVPGEASWPPSAGPPPTGLAAAQARAQADPRRDAAWLRRDRRLSAGLTTFAVIFGVFGGAALIVVARHSADNFWVPAATLGGLAGLGAVGTFGLGVGRYVHRTRLRAWELEVAGGGWVVRF